MIVIEGPDGAGKTMLATKLSKALNVPIHHSGGPPKSDEEIFARMNTMIDSMQSRVVKIYDRVAVISENVYGPIIRGRSPFDYTDFAARFNEAMRIPIIYCRPHIHQLMKVETSHAAKHGESDEHIKGVMNNQRRIVHAYDNILGLYPHWNYDFTTIGSSLEVEDIIANIKEIDSGGFLI